MIDDCRLKNLKKNKKKMKYIKKMMKYEICNVIQILKYNILKFILLPSNAYPSIMINMHNLLKYFQDAKTVDYNL